MINIDTRLLKNIDGDEFWLLIHLVKFLGKKKYVWPANATLKKDTGWGMEKLQRVKKSLIDKGFLISEQRANTSNAYRFRTKLIGIYNSVDGEIMELSGTGKAVTTSDGLTTGKAGSPYTGEAVSEVLSNEVLVNNEESEDSSYQKPLFSDGLKPDNKNKRREKETDPCYKKFIGIWNDAFPALLDFPRDGVHFKSIIRKTQELLSYYGHDVNEDNKNDFFFAVVTWAKGNHWVGGEPVGTFDSKYKSIVHQMKNGKAKPKSSRETTRDFLNSLRQA